MKRVTWFGRVVAGAVGICCGVIGTDAFAVTAAGFRPNNGEEAFIKIAQLSVWNGDSAASHSAIAPFGVVATAGVTQSLRLYFKNNGLQLTCNIVAVNVATGVPTMGPNTISTVNGFSNFQPTVTLAAGTYAMNLMCSIPRINNGTATELYGF